MHRFHDPGGALFATLPQWPRMNSKLVRSIDRPRTFKQVETPPLGALFHAIIRPAFALAPGNSKRCMHLRSRLRPRHYRASLCSDAAASRMATRAPGAACRTGCIGLYLATFGAYRMHQSPSSADLANLNLDNAFLVVGWFRSYVSYSIRECQFEIALPISPDHGLQIAER